MDDFNRFEISRHARARANQRGVTNRRLAQLISYADVIVSVGHNLSACHLSRRAVEAAIHDGLPPSQIERLSRLAIIEADDGTIVTVAAIHGRKGRHYKRRMRRFWKGPQV